jgi:hypothetical protein
VSENRVLRIFGPKRDDVTGGCRNCIIRSFIAYNNQVNEEEMRRTCSTNGENGMHIGYWSESQKEIHH